MFLLLPPLSSPARCRHGGRKMGNNGARKDLKTTEGRDVRVRRSAEIKTSRESRKLADRRETRGIY